VALAGTDGYGVIHATGAGEVTWHDLAVETLRLAGLTGVPVHPTTSVGTPQKVRRPAYSILSRRRLRELGVDIMRPWHEALAEYVASLPG
jgi:dTDP-4-dehydrorhamnose reductase